MQPRKGCVPLGEWRGRVNASPAHGLSKIVGSSPFVNPAASGSDLGFAGAVVTWQAEAMHANPIRTAACALLVLGLGACAAADDTYPSLAIRPVERGILPPAPQPPAPPIRPPVAADRLAQLRAEATAANTAFQAREREAAPLARAAAGQPIESNARGAALVALARLDTEAGKTKIALAALDTLAAEAAGALSPDPALAATHDEVVAIAAQQDAAIARLWQTLGS